MSDLVHEQDDQMVPLLERALGGLDEILFIVEAGRPPEPDDSRIIFANGQAATETGYSREELVGKVITVFYADATSVKVRRRIDAAFRESGRLREDVQLRTKDGRPYWAELVVAPLGEARPASHFLVSARNVDARKQAEELTRQLQEQLLQSQKLETIGVLASGIAHDFNNILTGIVGSAELVKMTLPQPHPAHDDLDNIMQAAQRAAGLTRELLAYASTTHKFELINLNQMVTSILVILRSQMSRSIIVRKALMPDVPNVEADPVQVQQAMLNLCLNASDAMREQGGILSITTDKITLDKEQCEQCALRPKPGEYAVFEVSDTGSGIDPDPLKHIFEPFYTTRPGARGLGLAVVHSIVKAHQGGIQVQSEPGQGTTVRVFLPASGKHLREETPEQASQTEGTQTILFVDDEEVLRSLGQRALERFGYRVLLAADGVEAVRIFREKADEIDLVILDLSMPRKGGEDAYQEMRAVRKDLKILLCCGYNEAVANTKVAGENVVGFLPKPFGIDTLAQTVQAALSTKK